MEPFRTHGAGDDAGPGKRKSSIAGVIGVLVALYVAGTFVHSCMSELADTERRERCELSAGYCP